MRGAIALIVFGAGLLASSAFGAAGDTRVAGSVSTIGAATAPAETTTAPTDTPATVATEPAAPATEAPQPSTRSKQASASSSATVSIQDNSFNPASVTVNAGDSVTWNNKGKAQHNVTFSGFASGTLSSGQSYSHKFSSAGTFAYQCTFHAGMTGTVTVASKSSTASGSGSSGSSTAGVGVAGVGSESAAGSTADAAGSSSTLPKTGMQSAALALLGGLLLLAGLRVRRRAS
jgi:LPXTG-motif cell wall-anchored protein